MRGGDNCGFLWIVLIDHHGAQGQTSQSSSQSSPRPLFSAKDEEDELWPWPGRARGGAEEVFQGQSGNGMQDGEWGMGQ